jgi:hypothetical protein
VAESSRQRPKRQRSLSSPPPASGRPPALGFTFFGDLLGFSSYYRLGADIAYRKLDGFYNAAMQCLEDFCRRAPEVRVTLFSDSVFLVGDDPRDALPELSALYSRLLEDGLLMRGAIVSGKLAFDPRIAVGNFEAKLPSNDTLARAVGLEKTQKGARLLIEGRLAHRLFRSRPDWATHGGYIRGRQQPPPKHADILRRICPTPDNTTFEYLYYWTATRDLHDYRRKIEELAEVAKMQSDELSIQYRSTIDLLRRCEARHLLESND